MLSRAILVFVMVWSGVATLDTVLAGVHSIQP